jgi:hypothetical protein
LGEFSAIRKEDKQWVFDYWAGTDPSGELHTAGAILVEAEVGDNNQHRGSVENSSSKTHKGGLETKA